MITGGISDCFARRPDAPFNARLVTGLVGGGVASAGFPGSVPWTTLFQMKEEARAVGLHNAFYISPVLGVALVLVLFAASRTVAADYRKLQHRLAEAGPGKSE